MESESERKGKKNMVPGLTIGSKREPARES